MENIIDSNKITTTISGSMNDSINELVDAAIMKSMLDVDTVIIISNVNACIIKTLVKNRLDAINNNYDTLGENIANTTYVLNNGNKLFVIENDDIKYLLGPRVLYAENDIYTYILNFDEMKNQNMLSNVCNYTKVHLTLKNKENI